MLEPLPTRYMMCIFLSEHDIRTMASIFFFCQNMIIEQWRLFIFVLQVIIEHDIRCTCNSLFQCMILEQSRLSFLFLFYNWFLKRAIACFEEK